MDNLQSQETSNPCSISQYAALQRSTVRKTAWKRCGRNSPAASLYARSNPRASRINLPDPAARSTVLQRQPVLRQTAGSRTVVTNSTDFCSALLEESHVALVSGDASELPLCAVSFATAMEVIEAGWTACRILARVAQAASLFCWR